MTVPDPAYQTHPPVAPVFKMPWFDKDGMATTNAQQFLQQLYAYIVGMNRIIPCTCSFNSNLYTLTVLTPSPFIERYNDYDVFTFYCPATSTGTATAQVVTNSGALAAKRILINDGLSVPAPGAVVVGALYMAVFSGELDAFVLK